MSPSEAQSSRARRAVSSAFVPRVTRGSARARRVSSVEPTLIVPAALVYEPQAVQCTITWPMVAKFRLFPRTRTP